MTMYVNLSPEMGIFIRNKVASGFYGNATELVRDAIRRMQADEARVAAWRIAIKVGDEQLEHGEGVPYTAGALADITQRAIGAMRGGKAMGPEVLPQ